jgi:hypothetical protein
MSAISGTQPKYRFGVRTGTSQRLLLLVGPRFSQENGGGCFGAETLSRGITTIVRPETKTLFYRSKCDGEKQPTSRL